MMKHGKIYGKSSYKNMEIDEILVELIQDATEKALNKLFQEHKENFYYCSLITTGEGLCPIISAWSKEALERVAGEQADVEVAKYDLKWSYAETPYFAYGEEYFETVNKVFTEKKNKLSAEEEIEHEITNTERALRLNPKKALEEWLEEIAEEI